MSYNPVSIDYSNVEAFPDERLLNDHRLLKGEILAEVNNFMANLLDDYDNLRRIEEELSKRGLIAEKSPMPFFVAVPEE